MNCFKYQLKRGGGSMFISADLTWFERLKYRLKGYKIIKLTNSHFDAYCNDGKKTTVNVEIKF